MKTLAIKPSNIKRKWWIINARGQTLGRVSTEIVKLLRGKHRPEYTPNMDLGDNVIVINAKEIQISGKKRENKIYYRHSGYPGGLKTISFKKLLLKNPVLIIKHAVRGMLPKGPLGRKMFKKMYVYIGEEHRHIAQQPQILNIEER